MKTKDYIFIGMITIISLVIYMLAMGIASLAGTFGSGISPGIQKKEFLQSTLLY